MSTPKNTLKSWFVTKAKPLQSQFWAWMDSFWHKDELIPIPKVEGLQDALNSLGSNPPITGSVVGNGSATIPAGKVIQLIAIFNQTGAGTIGIGPTAGSDAWTSIDLPASENRCELMLRYNTGSVTLHFTSTINFDYAIYTL